MAEFWQNFHRILRKNHRKTLIFIKITDLKKNLKKSVIAKDILSIQNVTFCVNFATCQNKNRKFVQRILYLMAKKTSRQEDEMSLV